MRQKSIVKVSRGGREGSKGTLLYANSQVIILGFLPPPLTDTHTHRRIKGEEGKPYSSKKGEGKRRKYIKNPKGKGGV